MMNKPRQTARVAIKATELPDDVIEQIRQTRMSPEHHHLNSLLDQDEMQALRDKLNMDEKS